MKIVEKIMSDIEYDCDIVETSGAYDRIKLIIEMGIAPMRKRLADALRENRRFKKELYWRNLNDARWRESMDATMRE
jgi:hypothetical protein